MGFSFTGYIHTQAREAGDPVQSIFHGKTPQDEDDDETVSVQSTFQILGNHEENSITLWSQRQNTETYHGQCYFPDINYYKPWR